MCVCVVKIYYSYYLVVVVVVNGFDMSSHITVLCSFHPQSENMQLLDYYLSENVHWVQNNIVL